ncbi:MAG: alpha/beta fold hydrolase [Eggerthellaceae bacterium]
MDYAYDLQRAAAQELKAYEPVEAEDLWIPGTNQESQLHVMLWTMPESQPRGVVQLVHGMTEHIGRYADFASFLVSNGFAVIGHDHLGHGKTCTTSDQQGHIPLADGAQLLVEDVHRVRLFAQERFGRDLPYVLFGHSMGSFVCRNYVARYGKGLAAAVFCGTGTPPLAASKAGNLLCHVIAKLKGEKHQSKLVDSLATGGYNKAIANPRTPFDWLSYNRENVDAYLSDPDCGFMFSVGGYATLTALTAGAVQRQTAEHYPAHLPILFVSGEDDPVGGSKANGVKSAYKLVRSAVTGPCDLQIFPYMRHEILNERERGAVYSYVLDWICRQLEAD